MTPAELQRVRELTERRDRLHEEFKSAAAEVQAELDRLATAASPVQLGARVGCRWGSKRGKQFEVVGVVGKLYLLDEEVAAVLRCRQVLKDGSLGVHVFAWRLDDILVAGKAV